MIDETRYKGLQSKAGTVHAAAEVGSLKALDEHIRSGLHMGNPESVTLQQREEVLGMMPLHVACEKGHFDVVQYLIKKRVDLDAGDNFRVTPLHLAAIEDHFDIVEELLDHRANVKPFDCEGDLPIHWAATKGHTEVIKVLLKGGSPLDLPNNAGWTPLHRAAYNGRRDAVRLLVTSGASLTATTKDGNTPLHLACFMNHLGTIEVLCELEARQDVLNNMRQTPMDLCVTDAAREILRGYGWGFVRKLDSRAGEQPMALAPSTAPAPAPAPSASHRESKPPVRSRANQDGFPNTSTSASPRRTESPPPFSVHAGQAAQALQAVAEALEPLASSANPYHELRRGAYGTNSSTPPGAKASTPSRTPSAGSVCGSDMSGLRKQPSSNALGKMAPPTAPKELPPVRLPASASSGGNGLGPVRPPSGRVTGFDAGDDTRPLSARFKQLDQLRGSMGSAGNGLSPWASLDTTTDDYQSKIKEENRKSMAAADSILTPRNRRPQSGNKKFLSRYNLDKLNLFAP